MTVSFSVVFTAECAPDGDGVFRSVFPVCLFKRSCPVRGMFFLIIERFEYYVSS